MKILRDPQPPVQETCERNRTDALMNLHWEELQEYCKREGINWRQCNNEEHECILEDYLMEL